MKRLFSTLLILCMILSCAGTAFAAGKPSFSLQPADQTVKVGKSCSFSVKVKNQKGLTWYLVNPETGDEIPASQASKVVKGLKVSNPNGQKLTLKKVPEELHGWSVFCRASAGGVKVDSDSAMILISGMEAPSAAAPRKGSDSEDDAPASSVTGKTQTDASGSFTVTVSDAYLYEIDAAGKPVGDPKDKLTFDNPSTFYVKADGPVQYWMFNSIKITPDTPSDSGLLIRGISGDTSIRAHIARDAEEADTPEPADIPDEPADGTEDLPDESGDDAEDYGDEGEEDYPEDEPAADEQNENPKPEEEIGYQSQAQSSSASAGMVYVTCENCRFSGGGLNYVSTGEVPAGTEITVTATSLGDLESGYSINGDEYSYKGKVTFRLTVNEDTTITMKNTQ